MTATVFIHAGPHKTGSTFIQAVLQRNKQQLASAGVLFPGEGYDVQRRAVTDLLRTSAEDAHEATGKSWDALVTEMHRWAGKAVIISHEGLARASSASIQRLVEPLTPAEVHLVYAVRDLTKVIPGSWQTRVRNWHSESWDDYLAGIRGGNEQNPRWWRGQDPRTVFTRWERHIPRHRIHLITVPPPGTAPEVLWQRFCAVVGLDATDFSLDVARVNPSLGTAETELVRRINGKLGNNIDRRTYDRWVQGFICRRVLEKRPSQAKLAMPVEEYEWLRTHAEELIAFLERERYEVTGSLDELLPQQPDSNVVAPDAVDLDRALDAAADVIAALVRRRAQPRERSRSAGRRSRPAVLRRVRASMRALVKRSSTTQ